MYYVYIIYSGSSDVYYVGSSSDPEKRLQRHNEGVFNTYTSKRRPWLLEAIFEAGSSRSEAERLERFIKK
ncbi:MAG: GIY-YIG nuclease family protein, partial [Bacteroidota bacterium]